jgi:AbrB family looped-hinge helix DNA binding protein
MIATRKGDRAMIEYKGYIGTVDVDFDSMVLHGNVINTRDVVTFEAKCIEDVIVEFHVSVNEYLRYCNEREVEPNRSSPLTEEKAVKINKKGGLTIPKPIRDKYQMSPGDHLALLDLGGVFVLSPRSAPIDMLANRISEELESRGETLESMLEIAREQRDKAGD